jgi:hypothetical protein
VKMTAPRRSSAPTEPDSSILQHPRRGTYRSSYDGVFRGGDQRPQTIDIDSQGLVNHHRRGASDEIELLSPVSDPVTTLDSVELSAVDIEANAGAESKHQFSLKPICSERSR